VATSEHTISVEKRFRDPVHNLITFEGEDGAHLLQLVDTPEFQRLRRIRQLGLSCFTYHGTEHSRFAHSLGVYHVARQMLDGLARRRPGVSEPHDVVKGRRLEILVAALLHDVGHAPLSHVLEDSLTPRSASEGYPRDHEGWTNISSLSRIDWEYVDSIFDKRSKCEPWVRSIISSQLDADRLDYLLRDSYAAGVPYGSFDLEWLMDSIRIGSVKLPGVAEDVPQLCFSTKAQSVVEQFVLARNSMYVQVYIHKTTRAFEATLLNAIELAGHILRSGGRLPGSTHSALRKALRKEEELSVDEYLQLDDLLLWSALRTWAGTLGARRPSVRLLARKAGILVHRMRPYRRIELQDASQWKAATQIRLELAAREGLGRFSYYVDDFSSTPYKETLYAGAKDGEDSGDQPIYIGDDPGRARPIETESDIIGKLLEVKTECHRAYYDEEDADVVAMLRDVGLVEGDDDA